VAKSRVFGGKLEYRGEEPQLSYERRMSKKPEKPKAKPVQMSLLSTTGRE
jgi:hypothetical protein